MGLKLKQTAGAGAPTIDDGLTDLRFDGITAESHPDWAGEGKFGYDDGERWKFAFTALDEDGAVVYDEGEPIVVGTLTNQTLGKKSNAFKLLKGILNAKELALIEAGEELDSDSIEGRIVQGIIAHNGSGWPEVESVMPGRKALVAALAKASK